MNGTLLYRSFVLGRSPLAASASADRRHSASKLADLNQKVPAARNSGRTLLHLAQINSLSDQSRSSVTPSPSESSRKSSPADKPVNPLFLPRSGEAHPKKDDGKPASKTSSFSPTSRLQSWSKKISLGAIGRQNATETQPEGLESRPGVKSGSSGCQKTLTKQSAVLLKTESRSESKNAASKVNTTDSDDCQMVNGAKRKVKARLVRQATSFDFGGEPPGESTDLQNSLKDISTSTTTSTKSTNVCRQSDSQASLSSRRKSSTGDVCSSCRSAIPRHRRGSAGSCSCVAVDGNGDALQPPRRRKSNLISMGHQQHVRSDSFELLRLEPPDDVTDPVEVLSRLCLIETSESPHLIEARPLRKSNHKPDTFCRKHMISQSGSLRNSTGNCLDEPTGLTVTVDVHAFPDRYGCGYGSGGSPDYDPVQVLENDVAQFSDFRFSDHHASAESLALSSA